MPGNITEIVRPNANQTEEWDIFAYTKINDIVIDPAQPGDNYIQADKDDDDEEQQYATQNPTGDFETADQLELHVYVRVINQYPDVWLIINGWPTESYLVVGQDTWLTFTFTGSWTKADLNSIIIVFLAPELVDDDYVQIRCAYVKIFGLKAPYPIGKLKKRLISGYNCFMNAYLRAKAENFAPLRLPDGTVF